MITRSQLETLKNKEFRHLYVSDRRRELIAAQIRETREERGWSQEELGTKAGMAQGRVSLLEDPDYSSITLKTLERVGQALDVALLVEYVSFRELLERTQSGTRLSVPNYDADLATTSDISSTTLGIATATISVDAGSLDIGFWEAGAMKDIIGAPVYSSAFYIGASDSVFTTFLTEGQLTSEQKRDVAQSRNLPRYSIAAA